jgi:hypothetical protein
MKHVLRVSAVLLLVALFGCGDDSPTPTSELADCLTDAGAEIAIEESDMEFVVDDGSGFPPDYVGLDRSGTLSVGSFHGSSNGGWKVYYVVRKGYQLSLGTLLGNPEKAAKVVAYIHPPDTEKIKAANSCLRRS